jgi:hypothetical protein
VTFSTRALERIALRSPVVAPPAPRFRSTIRPRPWHGAVLVNGRLRVPRTGFEVFMFGQPDRRAA